MSRKSTISSKRNIFPATVVKVLNEFKVVINRGSKDGIKVNQRFLLYILSDDEIVDPETNKKLGFLEIVRGTGKVVHVQENMATIESDTKGPSERLITRLEIPIYILESSREEEKIIPGEQLPFENASVGDKAKPI